jgi:hypothetical protein
MSVTGLTLDVRIDIEDTWVADENDQRVLNVRTAGYESIFTLTHR